MLDLEEIRQDIESIAELTSADFDTIDALAEHAQALTNEVERLREIATAAADTVQTVHDYQGSATTQQAMNDAMWRLWRTLQRYGYSPRPGHDLHWRGSIIAALERAGLGIGKDGEVRIRTETDAPWQPAAGELVTAWTTNKCGSAGV